MKKGILLMMVLSLLILAGCGQQPPAETTEATEIPTTQAPAAEPTTVPTTEPAPETQDAEILADHVPAVLMVKNRGDKLDVVGEYDEEHFAVKTDSGYGLVLKTLVRLDGAESYEGWTGYAQWNAEIFDNFYLSGESVKKIGMNVQVEILEDLGTCYLVKVEDTLGFMAVGQISRWPITFNNSSGDSDGGGGGGGGQDGGDITMKAEDHAVLLSIIQQEGNVTGQAEVLADGTPVILGYFSRGDKVPVVVSSGFGEEKEGKLLLYWDGIYAYVDQNLTLAAGKTPYEAWDGYVASSGKAFDNYHLMGTPMTGIWLNLPVHVMADLGDVYLVEVNESVAYMAKDGVSKTQTIINYGGGGDDSGGGGGGNEWSDPVL